MKLPAFVSTFLLTLFIAAPSPTALADFPALNPSQVILEWNAQSDEVGSHHVKESRLALESLAKNYLGAPAEKIVKIPETASLSDFHEKLKKSLDVPADRPEVVRIFVNSHGSIDSFQTGDGSTSILWKDFVETLSATLKQANPRPKAVELYLSPCYSGSILPHLKEHLKQSEIGGVEVNVWAGSSGFTTTSSPEFPEALQGFANLKFTLEKYLSPEAACSDAPAGPAGVDQPIDLIGSLGGISFSEFWTNSGKTYRELSSGELEQLIRSEDPFLEEMALISLLRKGGGTADSAPSAVKILQDPNRSYTLRGLAAAYLGQLPKNDVALPALSQVAKDPGTKNSAHSIRSAAIDAMGYADPASASELMRMYKDPVYKAHQGRILEALGATKAPEALDFLKPFLESPNISLRQGARTGLFRSRPSEALAYFESKLKDPKTSAQERYGIYSSVNDRMPESIGPKVARLMTDEYRRTSERQKLDALKMIADTAKQHPGVRNALRKELLPTINTLLSGDLTSVSSDQRIREEMHHAGRLLQIVLEQK